MNLSQPNVVYRDDRLLVLDKPAHLPTTAPDQKISLSRLAHELDPDARRLHPTSRLDSPVTGLVIFARDAKANKEILKCRQAGAYVRQYVGVCLKAPTPEQGDWDWSISIDSHNPRLRQIGDGKGLRSAKTHYRTASSAPFGALLQMSPVTGRTHQLRVHAAQAQCALFGDTQYGGDKRCILSDGKVVTARRVMLHCRRIVLSFNGEKLEFESPIPADFRACWEGLGGTF